MQEKNVDPRKRQIRRKENQESSPHEPAQEYIQKPERSAPPLDPKILQEMLANERERAVAERSNPLLERARLPGETFALPSGAYFYTHGEIDGTVVNGEVVVYPMVTLDELVMKTPDKLLNGTGLEEVFRRCIPQILRPLDLTSKDVDFLMICLRKVTYGNEFEIEHTHTCKGAKEHSYVISLSNLITKTKQLNEKRAINDYRIILPNEQVVELTPPKYLELLKFYQTFNNKDRDQDAVLKQVIDSTLGMIEKVDGISDKDMIREWIETVPAGYITNITDKIAELSEWGVPLKETITCKDCGSPIEIDISLNPISFFS